MEIEGIFLKTDVTCVKCLENYVFAGIGGNLHVFNDNGNLLQSYNIFPSQRIYGIVPNKRNVIAVYGSNKIKTIEFDFINSKITKTLTSTNCEDWILDLKWINGIDDICNIITVFAHNYITLWTPTDMIAVRNIACRERCLLYSASVVNDNWDDLYVCSGTVFSEVLIWKPSESPYFCRVLSRLIGHEGVIFSINIDRRLNVVVTTSDDRTVRFWNAKDAFGKKLKKIAPMRTMYGHLARVFKSLVIEDMVVTSGEDSVIFVWNINGDLIRKFDAHQGGCIWSIDQTNDRRLISGGGDAGVSIYPFKINSRVNEIVFSGETPKTLKILSNNDIVLINEEGELKQYNNETNEWNIISIHNELKSYCVMDVNETRNMLALGGFHGHIIIYKLKSGSKLERIVSDVSTNNSRIFSIRFLSDDTLLTSENDGKLQAWCLGPETNYYLYPMEEFLLPTSKERWATSSVLLNIDSMIVGDRKGNVYLYKSGEKDPIQSVKKAHNHLGITNLYTKENRIISIGRNGIVKQFQYDKTVTQTTQNKLPFAWLCRILKHKETTLILGFSGSNFIVWDDDNRRILHEINCGGGHRSWDFHIDENENVHFVFIKEKTIQRFECKWTSIATVNIVEGYHTKEINTVAMLPTRNKNEFLLISGGEDTTIRLGITKRYDFAQSVVFKSHLSSVRCLKTFPTGNETYLIVSAGGRAQIILWELKFDTKTFDIKETDNYYKHLNDSESEIRVMDFTIINKRFLITACSDGTLQIYEIVSTKLKYLHTITYALKCITKIDNILICGRNVVITTATDGKIVFWDFTNVCNEKFDVIQPFYHFIVHQSGINSINYRNIKENTYLIASGGDDNAFVVNLLKIEYNDNVFDVQILKNYTNTQCHGAQITGVCIFDGFVVTTSIDQNVSVFKYTCDGNDLECSFIRSYSSVIADIQGMDCLKVGNEVVVCLYGKGVEIITIKM